MLPAISTSSNLAGTSTAGGGSGGHDPNFADVVLLMGFEGLNNTFGAPGFSDESSLAHGVMSGGAASFACVSTARKKFGSSSLLVNGDVPYYPNSSDWHLGSGSFTIETFIYPTALSGSSGVQQIIGQWQNAPNLGWIFFLNNQGLSWYVSTTGTDINTDLNTSNVIPNNTWTHVCVDYDGTKYRMYIDGVMVASSTTARNIFASTLNLAIGGASALSAFFYYGNMDELRITKGLARYADDSGFTIPSAAFPRST